MSEELKAAQARIACLEGEIAKRDEELAACRVAVENCEVFRARIAELEARIVELECELSDVDFARRVSLQNESDLAETLNQLRAELAASKAKVPVTNDESGLEAWAAGKFGVGGAFRGELCGNTDWALARLVWSAALAYAAPVSEAKAQGVTDEQAAFEAAVAAVNERGWSTSTDLARQIWNAARLSAAPAAPAEDALLVEALRKIMEAHRFNAAGISVTEVRSICFDALAAHRAKGVV